MRLRVDSYHQRIVKKHIDAALMKRKVRSRKKREYRRSHYVQKQPAQMEYVTPVQNDLAKRNEEIPVMTLIEYATIWTDVNSVDPSLFLKGIPTLKAIEFIVSQQNRIIYAPSDFNTQAQMIGQLVSLFGGEEEIAILKFVQDMTYNGHAPILFDNNSCLHFYLLALQNYDASDKPLNGDDYKNIFKAYLYCSHYWLAQQQRNIKGLGLTDLSILIDIPVVEFKTYKDFKAQLYRATRFFIFCKQNPHFGQFAQWFLEDKGVANASEYLVRIRGRFSDPLIFVQKYGG